MYLEKNHNSLNFKIIVRNETERRLAGTCFRGTPCRCAGNFFYWRSAFELFSDPDFLSTFLDEVGELYALREFGTSSFTVNMGNSVGWASTGDLSKFNTDDLEVFNPNRRSVALKLKTSCINIKAPMTSLVTCVFELRDELSAPVVIVHSIYPGQDIGELKGDVTAREGCVFFDWNHPGA